MTERAKAGEDKRRWCAHRKRLPHIILRSERFEAVIFYADLRLFY